MTIAHRLGRYLESDGVNDDALAHTRTLTSSRSAQAAQLLVKSVIVHHELGHVVAVAPSTHRLELVAGHTEHASWAGNGK
jgi:Ala-tRNA(Pro) deacylase